MVEIYIETHPEMVVTMENFVLKFRGAHINKILNCQGKGFKDLPMLNNRIDEKNE